MYALITAPATIPAATQAGELREFAETLTARHTKSTFQSPDPAQPRPGRGADELKRGPTAFMARRRRKLVFFTRMDDVDELEEGFNTLAGMLDYSMFIVTAAVGSVQAGCLVGFAAQCSITPSRFMVWLSKKNHTYTVARQVDAVGVHLLSRNEFELARLFGSCTGFEKDKFAECGWQPGPAGVPLLDHCPGVFVGQVLERQDTGDHVGFLLRPTSVRLGGEGGSPLTFQDVCNLDPGNEA